MKIEKKIKTKAFLLPKREWAGLKNYHAYHLLQDN